METIVKYPIIRHTLAFIFAKVTVPKKQNKTKTVLHAATTRLMKTNGSQERVYLWQERERNTEKKRGETDCFSASLLFIIINKLYL